MALRMLHGVTRTRVQASQTSIAAIGRRSLSISSSTLQGAASTAPTGQKSPFIEPAGRNPAEDSAPFSAQLQEYGAWM